VRALLKIEAILDCEVSFQILGLFPKEHHTNRASMSLLLFAGTAGRLSLTVMTTVKVFRV